MKFLKALCLSTAVASFAAAPLALAQTTGFPTRPIKMVVAWSPGGATDILARMVSVELSKQLGQQVVVDNRPGANGTIGHGQVATSPADGYTLIMATNSTYAIAEHLYTSLSYKHDRDLAPISLLASSPLILAVKPTSAAGNIADLIDQARKQPGKLNIASGGNGSTSHLAAELFMNLAGVSMTNVPYKGGGPATNAVAANEVDAAFLDLGVAVPFATAGRIKAIGVAGARRSPLLAGVPTIVEAGVPQFDATTNFALFAPAGTPRPVIDRLSGAVRQALADKDLREKLLHQGVEVVGSTPEELRAQATAESAKWGRIISDRHITLD